MEKFSAYELQQIHDKQLRDSLCVAAVVQVIGFDKEKMTVNVQPLSQHLEHGKYESQPPILRVPVVCFRSGGFLFRPWYEEGDVGIVVYLDHDMDSAVSGGKETKPLTERGHSATDAIFIGGLVTGDFTVKELPDEAHVLAREDGGLYLAVTKEKVSIKNGSTTADFMDGSIDLKSDVINIQGGRVNIN